MAEQSYKIQPIRARSREFPDEILCPLLTKQSSLGTALNDKNENEKFNHDLYFCRGFEVALYFILSAYHNDEIFSEK